jgi:flagellar hook protein FlgE
MALAGIDTLFSQGSLQDTGKLTDLAIQGDGFFILSGEEGPSYTRDGNLDVGLDGSLLNLATGMKVMGWRADENGDIDVSQELETIEIPFGQSMARITDKMDLRGNLDAEADINSQTTLTLGAYDSLGNLHNIELTLTKTANNQWDWTATSSDTNLNITGGSGTITFESDGSYSASNPLQELGLAYTNGAESPVTIDLDLTNATQLSGSSELNISSQNGLPPGSLSTFSVGSTGEIVGIFSNGLNRKLGQIGLATFLNSGGLLKKGQSLFATSANSGVAQVGPPGQDGRGQVSGGYLEMSNVELAQQFTSMIVAQRGFQANSRVITASDEMLQELVNLKR